MQPPLTLANRSDSIFGPACRQPAFTRLIKRGQVFSSWRDISFTENHIRQLHQTLLRHSEKDAWHRGNYKTNSNSVAALDESGSQIGIVFRTATPLDTPRLMAELVSWVNSERQSADARASAPNCRVCSRTWPRDDRRVDQAHRRQSQHSQAAFPYLGRTRRIESTRKRPWILV